MNMNELIEKLKLIPDDIKINRLKSETNYEYIRILIMNLQSDELKLQMINKLSDSDKTLLVTSLQSDNLKLDYLKDMDFFGFEASKIAQSIKSDELKLQSLSFFDFDLDKKDIIITMQSDEKKIEAMQQHIKDTYYHLEIIKSLTSQENKIANLYLLSSLDKKELLEDIIIDNDEQRLNIAKAVKDDYSASIIIETIENEEKKKEAIDLLSKDSLKASVISTFKDDATKIEQLEKLNDDFAKAKVISTLLDEATKIEYIEKLNDDSNKVIVIVTLHNDAIKVEQIEKLSEDYWKAEVIKHLQDDNTKIEQLQKLNDDFAKAEVISSLLDNSTKIEQLQKLNDDFAKAEIIINLQDDSNKIEQLKKLNDDFAKAKVISSFLEDSTKIEQLEKLNDDFIKAQVISTLPDDTIKIEQLEKLNDDFAKAKVISTLLDEATKIEQLEKLNDDFAKAIIIESTQSNEEEILTENLLNDRDKLKKYLLDENRTYLSLGLDKTITIGMEIESEGIMSKSIEKIEEIFKRPTDGETRGWKSKRDGSLVEGVEVVSPILTDSKENLEDIYMICAMMQKLGQKTTERCGGHIHIGADYLKSKEAYLNLFEIWGNAEKIIYKMSNEKGTIPRISLSQFAAPISSKLNKAIERETVNLETEEDLNQFINEIQNIQGDRYSGLNLLNINNGINTIEFRIPNGTINADTWIENARLFGRIIQISQKLDELEKSSELSEEDKKLLDLKNNLKEEISEQEKMEILLELLFSEEERTVYRERYLSASKLLEHLPDNKNPFQNTKFSKVDFKSKKHTLEEFHEIAIINRIEEVNNVMIDTLQGIETERVSAQSGNKSLEEK